MRIKSGTIGETTLLVSCAMLAATAASGQESTRMVRARSAATPTIVEVDFGHHAYYPLVKERIGIFQEMEILASEDRLIANMPALRELPNSTFRMLGSFEDEASFNTPAQIGGRAGAVTVRTNPALMQAVTLARETGKLPVLSWYGTPPMVRGPRGPRGVPSDLPAYAASMAKLAGLYAGNAPLVWEVMNEPNLGLFLKSDDNVGEYAKIFAATSKAVKAANPDVLIAGPSFSDEVAASDFGRFTGTLDAAAAAGTPSPIDYFSFHAYRQHPAVEDKLAIVRNAVGDRFDTVPFIITEYENFHPTDTYETKHLRETATGAVFFFNHARMLAEQTDVGSVTWNRFMTTAPMAARANPGGLLSFEGEKRAIYNAFRLYTWLPADRAPVQVENARGLQVMAGADAHNAGVILWNAGTADRLAQIKVGDLPAAIAHHGRMRIYRIDAHHASGGDGAPPELETEQVQSLTSTSATLNVPVPTTGVVYLRFDDGSDQALDARHALANAHVVRSWSYVPRVRRGTDYVSEGNYGTVDEAAWVLRTGTRTFDGRGIAGLTFDAAPKTLSVRFTSFDLKAARGSQDINALRVDYWNGTRWSKSVMFHGPVFASGRTDTLPWGKGGASADAVIDLGAAIGNGRPWRMPLDKYAPADWDRQRRRVLVTAWSAATGVGAQSVVALAD